MKLVLIDGSPKMTKSASAALLKFLAKEFPREEISWIKAVAAKEQEDSVLLESDVLIFAFPLYVDSLPSHFVSYLLHLEKLFKEQSKERKVYVIVNCGFYEGVQNRIALQMMKTWCNKANLVWGQGVGFGGGGMISGNAVGKGPLKQIGTTLEQLAVTVLHLDTLEDILLDPSLSRKLYMMVAHFYWNHQAKKNGLKKKEIRNRLV